MALKNSTSEKVIEAHLVAQVKARGGKCIKILSTIENGLPDRLCLLPGGVTFFVEVKSTGERLRKLQELKRREIERTGHSVFVADSFEQIENILKIYV